MPVILLCIGTIVIVVLAIQSIILYKVYNLNLKKYPKLDTDSKEWVDFINLFRDSKIHNGYVVSYFNNEEEWMLRFQGYGKSEGYVRGKYFIGNVWFEIDGTCEFHGEEVPGTVASYDLNIDNIVSVTPIEEYYGKYEHGKYTHHVICTLKNGNEVQLIFE